MIQLSRFVFAAFATLAALSGLPAAVAQESPIGPAPLATSPVFRSWMSPEVVPAWNRGYTGKGSRLIFVDDFTSNARFYGNLGFGTGLKRHGEWTRWEGSLIAPGAADVTKDFRSGTAVTLGTGLNVINLSYGMYAASNYSINQIRWSAQESSIISYAGGRAIIAKAAGNDSINVGGVNSKGQRDYLNIGLIGRPSAVFVGALTTNGTTTAPARLATYSNTAGSNTTVQKQFLVVGVESNKTGLAGTSFAAPIVAGYAAIIGNKFPSATPTQITNQLLTTARKDTLLNFNAAIYGRGEASLTRALAPISIK